MQEEAKTWNKVNTWAAKLESLQTIIAKTELVETTKWGCIV